MKQFRWTVAAFALVMLGLLVGPAWAIEAKGKITRLDTSKNEFSMEPAGGGKLNFQFSKDIKVRLNGKDAKLSDLKVGDEVTINYARDGDTLTVSDLRARRGNTVEATGKITRLDTTKNEFSMEPATGDKLNFQFSKDIAVRLNGKGAKLSDLKVGDEVTINYARDGDALTVSDLRARRGNTVEATGKITRLDTTKNEFSMEPKSGGKLNFQLSKNIKVQLNDRNAKLSDLKVGDDVTINYSRDGDTLTVMELRARRKD